ncbi:uncharacterized protein ACJ7VT_000293 isoform 1-T1 [Polymixia lowei]
MHEQELFKLAAKSDASADLEQLLKALKQKLHEKEEVLLGKTQVIDVLQGEVDGRDQQIKELLERLQRLQVERENLESKLEAEKHVMRAQLRDLMEKQQAEVRRIAEQHQAQMAQTQQDLLGQLEELRRASLTAPPASQAAGSGGVPADSAATQRLAELEAQAKQKTEEANKSEAKFLKMKAWSKSRIRQLEEELKKSQAGGAPPDLTALRSRITELEEEREESLWKLEQYDELKAKNDVLEVKLVVYEEQQRTLQADLEQVTKRAASQASESGSADDTQSQVLEWQEMVAEAVSARDRAREEKAAMALRINNMEEEREALASQQQELEEELAQARGLGQHRAKKLAAPAQRSLQEDFEFDGQPAFRDPGGTSGSTAPAEGENMGGGLRSVVEELELERNQLQEQILGLEEHCQDLEDRLQLQARIEALQNESDRLQGQLASLRSQQSRDAEKHQLLVTSLNEQLKGLSDTQECLESSLIEKENTLAKTSEKLELISSLQESLSEKEIQYKDVSDKLLQTEHNLMEVSKKCSSFEKQCSDMKKEVVDVTQKLGVLKEKTQKQEVTIETLQTELDQTNDELDKLNTTHLEERAQLIHDLQSCEREIDSLKDILLDKEKEISTLSSNMVEYSEQITMLKQELKLKQEDLVRTETALSKAEREAKIIRDSQDSDQHILNDKITELVEKLKDTETELNEAKEESRSKVAEVEDLTKQGEEDKKSIQDLRGEIQKQTVNHRNHLSECETHISSLKEQIKSSAHKLQQDSEDKRSSNDKLQQQLHDKEQMYEKELKSFKEERNKLQAEVAKYNSDVQTLSKQLEEQTQNQERTKKVMQENLGTITSLEDQLKANQKQAESERERFNTELQARDSANEKLEKELASKSENISKLKNLLKNTKAEKQQLKDDLKGLTEELESQKQHVEQLDEKITATLQLNSSLEVQVNRLTEENETLHLEATESIKTISELTVEKESLQVKIAAFETQHSENSEIIQRLQKDKEELIIRTNELNGVLEQSTQSISETLLEKTNECSHLSQLFRDREEKVALLQEQVQSLISQVEELKNSIEDKERTATDLRAQIEAQQSQQTQLQETLSLLQEQGSSLKSGLTEKDAALTQKQEAYDTLQRKAAEQEGVISKLQAEAEALHGERSQLRRQVEEGEETFRSVTRECLTHKDELNKRNEAIMSLSSQLAVMEDNTTKLESEKAEIKTSLDKYGAENITMRAELEQRQAEIAGLHGHIQALSQQNHQLRAAYEIRERELAQQIQVASDLDQRLKTALEQNSDLTVKMNSLTEDNRKLQEDLAQKINSVSELAAESTSLKEKISGLDMQHSENRKIIEGLLKSKEELIIAADELNKVLDQSKQSHSESLLEKTAECNNLSKALREREEQAAGLQQQTDSLKTHVNQLDMLMNEKEKSVLEQSAHMEAQQAQIMQLQDTLSLLQEQASVLKLGLVEKDSMLQQKAEECSCYQSEVTLQKVLVSKVQSEAESLREQCLELHRQIEQKDQTLRDLTNDFKNHKDELNTQNESVMSLSSQLSAVNESSAKMEVEITNFKATVEKLAAENCQLIQEVDLRKVEIVHLTDNIQVLSEQNVTIKSELQKSVTEKSKLLEEITDLRSAVCERDGRVSDLTEELTSACSVKESLCLTLQQKDDSLKQQEMFVQQLQAKSVEVEGQTSQQSVVITQLQTKLQTLQRCLQDKDALLQQTERELSVIQEKFTSETQNFKTQLDSNSETIIGLESEFSDVVEKNKELGNRIAEQDIQLKQKYDANASLVTQVSEFEERVLKLRSQVDTLKETLKEKEQFIVESQRTSSAVCENLNSKVEAKEAECESMKEQLSHLQESVTKLSDALQAQVSEMTSLKEALGGKETALLDQTKSLQDSQRKADEAMLFKAQFMESTELIAQLQSQIQLFSSESANLTKSADDKQSAFNNLQEKYADRLEELQDVRNQLAQKTDEVSSLSRFLGDSNSTLQTAEGARETLTHELSMTQEELQKTQELNSRLSKEKEEAFAAHQTNMSSLTVEIERLKSQHLQVVAQMNALTENLEQREMALHAINSQYAAQAKHAAHLVSDMQKLEEQNRSLNEEISLSKEEHQKHLNVINTENTHLQQELNKLAAEKEELGRRHEHQIRATQERVQLEMQQQSSSMNESMERMLSEKQSLQAEVSVKGEEISGLKANIENIEQILQDSEKEWLLVLDRESKDKNLLVEQLKSVENEMKSKDFKVNALKQDLDSLQEKLSEAASAISLGSDQLKVKELEASASRVQLEKILASVQEKDNENNDLQKALQSMKSEVQKLEASKMGTDEEFSVLSQTMSERLAALNEEKASLQVMMKQLQESHQSELDSLKTELDKALVQLEKTEYTLNKGEKSHDDKCQQISLLQEQVEHLHEQLHTESEKVKEVVGKLSSVHNELQAKDEQMNCMSIQINQQKELLAGLSQQLKDKDASIAQVMESASNEMMKFAEEQKALTSQLDSMEQAHRTSEKRLEDTSQQLEEHIANSQSEIEIKKSQNGELTKENEHLKVDLAKLSKEKDAMKKKLQAALVVRKDLLRKIEEYENQKAELVNNGTETSLLQDKLQEITTGAQAATKQYEENTLLLEKKILEKEGEIVKLERERESLVENLQTDKQILQDALNEKEACLAETQQALDERSSLITLLQAGISEKDDAFQHHRRDLMQKLEQLQNDLKQSQDDLKVKCDSTAAGLEDELVQLKREKATLQKKAQAALLARKETIKTSQEKEKKLVHQLSEVKDDYKALLEQHCQQTDDLHAVQLKFDHQVKEVENIREVSLSQLEELETLRRLVEEKDETLQGLKAEKESEGRSLLTLQSELETLKAKLESVCSEVSSKDQALVALEQSSQTVNSSLKLVENDLEKAHAKIKEQMEELEKYQQAIQEAESKSQQERQTLIDDNLALQSQLNISHAAMDELKHHFDASIHEKEQNYAILMGENTALLEQRDLIKLELEAAVVSVSQKSLEVQCLQNTVDETQQQLNEEKDVLAEELEKAQLHCDEKESSKLHMESLQEKENAFRVVEQLRDEVATLSNQLREAEELNEQLHQNTPGLQEASFKQEGISREEGRPSNTCSEELEEKPKQRDDALFISQALVAEKEELIAALEQQLQRQIHLHEIAMEKMRTEVDELQQRPREDCTKTNAQDNQSKTALLTRKLQAALISRKELLKDNTTLKEQLETLSVRHEEKEAKSLALELSVSELKQQIVDLESFVSPLSKEKDKLITEVDRILNDNHNLSAACESLKLTIENITQQKQAFSCQLESLKDSQTEELSEWKAKHSELKQEYESLLQAYENVSSEMDKMRQLLEGSRRERQDALRKLHQYETERESLGQQAREIEEENGRIKEKMRMFAKAKQQKIEELEEENQKIKKEFIEFDKKQTMNTFDELTVKNHQLEAEISNLKESSEELRERLEEMQAENDRLAENLKEASSSLEKRQFESVSCENMQFKLNEALGLNNSLTVQIESQKTELGAQQQIHNLLQKEKQNLSTRIEQIQNDQEVQLEDKENVIKELQDVINKHRQETISLNERLRILEDDKSLLQEELENVQEISDKVKNENEYLETVILKNSEKIDDLTQSVNVLQTQNTQLCSQLATNKENTSKVCQEKEEQQLRLVKEFEGKLKTVQRGNEGSKNAKKELQELLKEKHHEINQLQQNCISYQELILDLERSWKTSQSASEQLEKELTKNSDKTSILEERSKQLEDELLRHKHLLQEATESIVTIQSEKEQLALELSERENKMSELQVVERTKALADVKEQHNVYMEKQIILQKQIDELQSLKEQESQHVVELRQQIDSKELQMNSLKRESETKAAMLSALSSTPQGLDATKQWNNMFQKTLHDKDSQLLEQGFVIKRFLEDMRVKEKEVNELWVTKSRLERTLNEYSVAAAAQQRQLFVMGASNTELAETLELMNVELNELRPQVERLEQDKSILNRQLADKEDVTSQVELNLQQLEKINSDTEAQLCLLQSQNDKLQADFEKQEAISLHLKTLLQNKDAEIASLLSSRDGQMSGYLEQLQANHRAQVAGCEDRLTSLYYEREKSDKELRKLETNVKSLQIKVDRSIQEKEQMSVKMETFRNSMISLQSERERLMSEYRVLEAKTQLGLRDREGSAEGEFSAAKGLKYEIRKLLHQMDDLNSENAMLRAQLVRYREDLNQVLSLKDNQLKVLLQKQQDMIKNLENQKAAAEKQHRESLLELQRGEEASNTLKAETSKLKTQVTKLEAEILALKRERAETNVGRVIADLQQVVAAKAAECNDHQQKLFAQKISTDELKGKLHQLEKETDKKLADAEDKYNSELDAFEREVELMRNERETADQRVAELAGDLLQTEQLLSEAKNQSKDMKAQNESLGKAMAALQNDRDQLIEDFKTLRNGYDKELRETQAALTKVEHRLQDATSEFAVLDKERHVLVHKMKALESQESHSELNKLVDELSTALSEKERQLKQVTLENDTYSKQVSAFSRSMASLQNDRDRLMDELVGAKRVVESRQGSDPGAVSSLSVEESNGSCVGVFQNEKDGLEMRLKVVELQKALQEAQAYRLQTEKEVSSYQAELADLRSERSGLQALKEKQQAVDRKDGQPVKEPVASVGQSGWEQTLSQLQTERVQLHRDLQRCLYEIQQRDQHYQQLNIKLQQVVEEKGAMAAQMRAVSQTLRDTQNRCHWLEGQVQGQAGGSACAEVAPGAPQERSSHSVTMETTEANQLRDRLLEVEQSLAEERARREAAEEALGLSEDRAQSVGSSPSRSSQRDFSIQLDTEEEWEALILNPNQPLLTRKVRGGVLACRRWVRGRSLYCSKLLTTRARSRYFFLAYLLTLHVVVLMCLAGAL